MNLNRHKKNSNRNKLEKVSEWYKSTNGANSFMIYCLFLEFQKNIKEPVLEIGPADGFMTKYILNKLKHKKLDLLEASKNYSIALQKKFPNLTIENVYLEKWKTEKKYNTVIASHILEHVSDPKTFLDSAYNLLAPDGLFIITVPNAKSIHRLTGKQLGIIKSVHELNDQDKKIGHFRVYDKKTLARELKKSKFKIKKISGSFLKFFSNSQLEDLIDKKNWTYFYKLGKNYPEYCADIYAICKKH